VVQLSKILPIDSPEASHEEVLIILMQISSELKTPPLSAALKIVMDLYSGEYPGYRACNTEYHDLKHTIETYLAMARLIHGATVEKHHFSKRPIVLGLISALLHDAGYIQTDDDLDGTGAKYTATHVKRSMDFIGRHADDFKLTGDEVEICQSMVLCTDLAADIDTIVFPSEQTAFLGKMLGTADLVAQMADRTYLEKLAALYKEFEEGGVGDYADEVDLLKKTIGFYDFIKGRMKTVLDSVDTFLKPHFWVRWKIDSNLYQDAMEAQIQYLRKSLETPGFRPFDHFKRFKVLEKVRETYDEK